MSTTGLRLASICFALLAATLSPRAYTAEYVEAEVDSDLVPGPVEYAVLLPDGYAASKNRLPLLLDLHGGRGNRGYLARMQGIFEELWQDEKIPKMVVVTPTVAPRCFYMDYRDGSEKWETFLTGPFLEHLRGKYRVRRDRQGTLLSGISMGGMGSLRMALKYPQKFGGVAAMEPGIEPLLHFKDMRLKHRFWRTNALFEAAYGRPVDEDYWAANNPASILAANAEAIRESGLQIYIECGDNDLFWLYEGTEFLHQVLWNHRVKHEYHLVRGADHVGATVGLRKREALEFLARVINPPGPDQQVAAARKLIDPLKRRLTERDHYSETVGEPREADR